MPTGPKKQPKIPCFICWYKEQPCPWGTLRGSCISCGKLGKSRSLHSEYLFNQTLAGFMLKLAEETELSSLEYDNSGYHTLIVQLMTQGGMRASTHLTLHGHFGLSNEDFIAQLDEFVRNNLALPTHSNGVASQLTSKAALARAYLCLLFSEEAVVEYNQTIGNGSYSTTRPDDNTLSFRLMSLLLARLDGLLGELQALLDMNPTERNAERDMDMSAAVAMVYTGLMNSRNGLLSGRLRPIIGGHELATILLQRITSVSEQYLSRQILICCKDNPWAEHIAVPIENLRTNTGIQSLVLTLEKCYYETQFSLPFEPFHYGNIDTAPTPDIIFEGASPITDPAQLRSPAQQPKDFETGFTEDSTDQKTFYAPAGHYDKTGAAGQMAYQDLGYPGFDQWNTRPEQNVFTWTQQLSQPPNE